MAFAVVAFFVIFVVMKGLVHSLESFGSVDGPGVRYIIFLQGCNLRCRYCHNPDTWAVRSGDAEEMTAVELLDKAERFRSYWGKKGGITVSGGEPLLQIDFLIELFEEAKARGINTCVDTAAQPFTSSEPFISKFRKLMGLTDTVLLDIKHIDSEEHRRLTGRGNENILECARELDRLGVDVWIRHVLVPELTDRDEWLLGIRKFVDTLGNVRRVEVLPYHSMARFKYEKMGIAYSLEGVEAPSAERVANACAILGVGN